MIELSIASSDKGGYDICIDEHRWFRVDSLLAAQIAVTHHLFFKDASHLYHQRQGMCVLCKALLEDKPNA